ncbi:helix-turn-helix domain-containing protein [Xanthomonas vesicatoria]|uniref:AraC family transcriptional regulator n=1 Tax=Xanthomonas vesicatoria TaxID=56460 RepID=A0AAJ0J0M9_9XANT|nr:helix-turn-helix domain-containing protein [Xanthomonas vesicatoria]APO96034.1 AraC family transcriptional regulator [Xanthomonas vesicatoria]KHM92820.1 AraC family transcriptional regulator [Xanthomonas vesicatoria]KHM96849.1 AraC family transcriptional regulator [Xanthomonas vesicatoria]MCC8617747.1 helix-turn-helix domain-containing protein [Xanthomonas vesicatoria]MCC8622791.1 helix-turn-helix domain-containing protein [Xanthomonas vesicatoria]
MPPEIASLYAQLPPPPDLVTQLRCSWRYRQGAASAPVRVLPDGCVDLIWDGRALFVAGPDHTANMACVASGNVLTGIRLSAGAAHGVLGVPLHQLADQRVALDTLWGARGSHWQQRLREGGDALPTLHALCRQHSVPVDRQMAWIFAQLADHAALRVPALCAVLGISERQLRRRCHVAFGYGPKTLQRILRLQRFLRLAGHYSTLTAAALEAGYGDAPHLVRDARQLASLSPRELVQQHAR